MANLSQIKTESNWGEEAPRINQNFNALNTDVEKIKLSTTKFKGYFTSLDSLKSKYPKPQSGDTAWVGGTYPGTVYDVQNGAWHDTQTAPETGEVNLEDYATKEDLASLEGKLGEASGNIILDWNTDTATTRKQVEQSKRKALLLISYKDADGNAVNEQYIGTAYTDTEWAKDSNWEKIPNQEQIAILEYNSKIRDSIHNITWTEGYHWIADKSNPSFGQKMKSTTGRKASNLINIETYSIVEYTALVGTTGSTGGLVFFDKNSGPVSGEFFVGQNNGYKKSIIKKPENAVYVAFSAWIESTYGDFSANAAADVQNKITAMENEQERITQKVENIKVDIINGFFSIDDITWTEGYHWIADINSDSFGEKIVSTSGRKASNLIKINGNQIIEYTALVGALDSKGGLVFFDIVEQPISGEFFVGQSLGYKTRKIVSPENAVYVAFSAWIESTYGDFSAKILLNSTNSKYEDYTDNYKRFKVKVNQTPIPYWDTVDESTATDTLDDNEDLADCTGVIALPSTYTADGTPTRLILFAHGGHGYVDDTHWYPTNSNFPKLLEGLLDAGYAVFDCNGYKDTPYETISEWWANGNVQISEGLPQVIEAYYKCYQYIIAHYNVYPQVYVWGCSQGGHLAMNIGYMHREIVACIAMCAGQIDLYDQGYSYQTIFNRKQVAKLLGFTNQDGSLEAYEHYKADPFDPMKRITTIGDTDYVLGWNIPVKFFYGTADGTLPQIQYTKKLVKALQNSKTICQLRWFKGLGHDDIAVGANSIALKEIINWFNRF